MSRLILLILSVLFSGITALAQSQDTVLQLPDRLVVSSLKQPSKRTFIDSNGVVSIVCVNRSDSLIREQQRQLSGKLLSFTDTTLVLLVDQESSITYFRNGTMENFYYWQSEDSTHWHTDTVLFEQISTIRFDRGKFKPVIGIMQSTSYTYMMGNIVVLVGSFLTPAKFTGAAVSGRNLLISTGVGLAAGMASFIFYPKIYLLKNQPKKRKRIRWKIEMI